MPMATFPMTQSPSVSATSASTNKPRRATLTAAQTYAHAFGYPTPSIPSRSFPATAGLQTINEANAQEPSSPRTLAMKLIAKSQARRQQSLPAGQKTPLGPPVPRSPGSSSGGSSYVYTWTPGAVPRPIYDPDYPDGTPACNAPRPRTSSTSKGEGQTDYFSIKLPASSSVSQTPYLDHLQSRSKSRSRSRPPSSPSASTPVPAVDRPQVQQEQLQPVPQAQHSPEKLFRSLPPHNDNSSSLCPTPPTSSQSSGYVEAPLTISELTSMQESIGNVSNIFGHIYNVEPDGKHVLGTVPWTEMRTHLYKTRRASGRVNDVPGSAGSRSTTSRRSSVGSAAGGRSTAPTSIGTMSADGKKMECQSIGVLPEEPKLETLEEVSKEVSEKVLEQVPLERVEELQETKLSVADATQQEASASEVNDDACPVDVNKAVDIEDGQAERVAAVHDIDRISILGDATAVAACHSPIRDDTEIERDPEKPASLPGS